MKKLGYLMSALILIAGCGLITGPLEDRIDDLEAEIALLQGQVDNLGDSNSDIFDQVSEIESQMASLSSELSALTLEVDSSDTELLTQIQALQNQIAQLQARLDELVTIDIGLVLIDHYPSGDEWMRFENQAIQIDSSLVQVQFRSPDTTHFVPYDLVYSSVMGQYYYMTEINDGYILFRDMEYADKVDWDYKLVIFNP